jgi:hypothetical protein
VLTPRLTSLVQGKEVKGERKVEELIVMSSLSILVIIEQIALLA